MRKRQRALCSGVTMAEVVVASALLLACIVPLLRALTVAQVADRALERKSWSLLLAQQQLEQLRARCAERYDACYRADSVPLRDGYLCTLDDDEDPVLREVTVSVGLDRNADGVLSAREVEVSLSTRLARHGPEPPLQGIVSRPAPLPGAPAGQTHKRAQATAGNGLLPARGASVPAGLPYAGGQ